MSEVKGPFDNSRLSQRHPRPTVARSAETSLKIPSNWAELWLRPYTILTCKSHADRPRSQRADLSS